MTAPHAQRERTHSAGALGVAGLALLLVAALLSPAGVSGTVRTVLGCLALLVVPGWLVGRLADEDADAVSRIAGGTVVTLAVCALCGFVAFEHGLRVATAVFAVPLLIVVAVAALLGTTAPRVPRASLAPVAGAFVLGLSALLGAWGTHLALPAVPAERAFSIEAQRAVVSPNGVFVTVTVTRVRTANPLALALWFGSRHPGKKAIVWTRVEVKKANSGARRNVVLERRLAAGTTTCPEHLLVRVVPYSGKGAKANGAFLTPPVRCTGW